MLGIELRGKFAKKHSDYLKKVEMKSVADLARLADKTVDVLKETIRERKQRPGGNQELENSMTRTSISKIGRWYQVGVGIISKLPKYWRAVNYGSSHIIGRMVGGHFEGERARSDYETKKRFIQERKTSLIVPKKPIPAMNYIEGAWNKVRALLPTMFGVR